MTDELKPDGYRYVPILIHPQELTRLRRIEEWAKEAYKLISGFTFEDDNADIEAGILMADYDAITAPVEDKE